MIRISRIVILMFTDIACVNLAYIMTLLIRFEFNVYSELFDRYLVVYMENAFIITMIKIAIFAVFGLYNSLWKYAGIEEIIKVVLAALGAFAAVLIYLNLSGQVIPRGVQGFCFFLDITLIGGVRLAYRTSRYLFRIRNFVPINKTNNTGDANVVKNTRVLLVGAGDAGASMIKEIARNPNSGRKIVAVIDDNPAKLGKRIVSKKIVGSSEYISEAVIKYKIDEIIIAIPSAQKKQIQGIINECQKTGCKLKILPAYIDLIDGKVSVSKLRDVEIEDLLGREPVSVNLKEISGYIERKIVLVTGGGGSIGSELCRQIAGFKPRKLIALDIYENSVFELAHEIHNQYPDLQIASS